jgi:hypothetical protein
MKPDKNFKLSKTVKRLLASMPGKNPGQFKKMMIDAELTASRPAPNIKEKKTNSR